MFVGRLSGVSGARLESRDVLVWVQRESLSPQSGVSETSSQNHPQHGENILNRIEVLSVKSVLRNS